MPYTFAIELDEAEIAALCALYEYQAMLPNRTPDPNERRRRPEVPNPIAPEQFAQAMVEAFVDKMVDQFVGQTAAKTAHHDAVRAFRAQRPHRTRRSAS